jgi:hypothetical protein
LNTSANFAGSVASVSDKHEVSPLNGQADHVRELLEVIEAGYGRSQRSLAKHLGIALGLTNSLLKQTARRGWVRTVRVKPNRVAYLITQAGMAERVRMSRDYVARSARFYASARDHLADALGAASEGWPGPAPMRVVFYGAGEIGEIAYVCLQATNLRLVGAVDETRTGLFFGLPVRRPNDLSGCQLAGVPFDRLVVTALDDVTGIEPALQSAAVPSEVVFWLRDWRWASQSSVTDHAQAAIHTPGHE